MNKFFVLYSLSVIALFFYSFTQVDLSLTLSRSGLFQNVEKSFQHIGYFNRPLSTLFFILIIVALFYCYRYFLIDTFKDKLELKKLWMIIIFTAVVLAFSYNAFSYDLFNYIFDAKIITHYHQNPYIHRALDYPGDPMLSFMQWTHRFYPYGPFWLLLTAPLSFIAKNIFLVNFFLFKFLAAAFYLGSGYFLWRSAKKLIPGKENFALVLFALNPLVIVESLVSSHNDIAMIFFAMFGIYLYFAKNKFLGILSVIISAAIKIPSAILLLPMLINMQPYKKFYLTSENFIRVSVLLSISGLIYSMTKLEIQPWYFLWILPFAALLKPNKYIIALIFGFSLGLVFRYSVYLYFGNWDGIALPLRNAITLTFLVVPVSLIYVKSRLGIGQKSFN